MSKAADAQRKALGKGLSALLPQKKKEPRPIPIDEVARPEPPSQPAVPDLSAHTLPLDWIHPNPNQPRQDFQKDRISDLAQSIRANGVIQPVTVWQVDQQNFQIIAGERRWRAAKEAGLTEIPVHVRKVDPDRILELALIENIQREDLNPLETAQAFEQLISHYNLTHDEVAARTGKDRSTITNFLRLLRLAPEVRQVLIEGRISMGHARAILGLIHPDDQRAACQQVLDKDLSVRATESLVKALAQTPHNAPPPPPKKENRVDPNTKAALDEMAMALGTKIKIVPRSTKSGRLEIDYYSLDDLQRIYEAIVK